MKPTYAIHPGPGDISAPKLARLYGLHPGEWCAWNVDDPKTTRGRRYEDYVHLGFRPKGDYERPKASRC